MNYLYKSASLLFTSLCFMSLAYMTFNQVDKYLKNDDTSTISFKKFTKPKYPTYTICFEDNDDAGGFYKTIELGNPYPAKVYFDGKYVRLEKRNMSITKFETNWYPNDNKSNITSLIGNSGSMYAPLERNAGKLTKHWMLFNESYLVPPAVFKESLRGKLSKIEGLSFHQCLPKCGPEWAWGSVHNITYVTQDLSNINFTDVTWSLADWPASAFKLCVVFILNL